MKSDAHIPALDGLRALAILLVIPHNANIYGDHPGLFWPLALEANAGWIGVQLFFVLSGFLITGNLLEALGQPHYFRNFYIRRALRILPLYYLVLFAGLVLLPIFFTLPSRTGLQQQGLPWLWVFLGNWVQPFGHEVPGFTHFWSLAVEEQFYLLWPLAVLLCHPRRLATLCLALVAAALASRLLLTHLGAPREAAYFFTICRMDALAIGALGALAVRAPGFMTWLAVRRNALALAAAALFVSVGLLTRLYSRYDWRTLSFGEPLLAAVFATAILCIVSEHTATRPGRWQRLLAAAPMTAIGRYSYGMYVLHLPIVLALEEPAQRWLAGTGKAAPALFALLVMVLTILAGWTSYMLLERHCLALKQHFAPRNGGMRTASTGDPI